jgi:hypothetical protein
MKYFYIAVTVEENKKYYSYVIKTNENTNLLTTLKIKNIICAALCPSKKEAARRVEYWNATYKANGTYLFNDLTEG